MVALSPRLLSLPKPCRLFDRLGDADTHSGQELHFVGRTAAGHAIVKPPPDPEVDVKAEQRALLAPLSFGCLVKDCW